MVSRELIKQDVDQLRDDQLERLVEFIAFLKFRERPWSSSWQPLIDSLPLFSDDFMATRNQPNLDVRETLE